MYKIISLACCSVLFFAISCFSQSAVQTSQGVITNLSEAKFSKVIEDISFNGLGGESRIPFNRIRGSRFWKDNWEVADLYTTSGRANDINIKLNLLNGEIHFKKNEEEVVLEDFIVMKIYFKKDSTTFLANVPNLYLQNSKMNAPVLLLTSGKYQFLKYIQRNLSSADSLFRTQKRYYFSDKIYYFLRHEDIIEPIKKLSKENLLKLLPATTAYNSWIIKSDINFKKEEDVIRFINYYNTSAANK